MLKKHIIYTTLIIGAVLYIQSCKITEQTMESQYRGAVGFGNKVRIDNHTNAILSRHQYSVIRNERSNDIYYETDWVPRLTYSDEVLAGVKDVRTRLIILARPTNRGEITLTGGPLQTYSILFEGQAEYFTNESTEWQKLPLTKSRVDYFREIAYQFRVQFSSGGIRN